MITVLPGFNVFSICKVYLELTSLGCFLRGSGKINRHPAAFICFPTVNAAKALTECFTPVTGPLRHIFEDGGLRHFLLLVYHHFS